MAILTLKNHRIMAKIYGLNGVLSGRQGSTVFAVRNGENIARRYQPVVANPNTVAQVASRAKLKLLSQLSAVFAPVIAFPKRGSVSSRNIFTQVNYPSTTFADNTADIELNDIKLTRGLLTLSSLVLTRTSDRVEVSLASTPTLDVDRVVYACFVKNADNTLYFAGSRVVSEPGTGNVYSTSFVVGTSPTCVVYAYGVRDNTEAARVKFGDMIAPTAETVAKLITSRQLLESDITLTETVASTSNPS